MEATPAPTAPIRVSLVEDNPASAALLQMVLSTLPGIEFLDRYKNAEQVLAVLPNRLPDLLLVDLHLPGMSGLELIGRVAQSFPEVRCLVLSGLSNDEAIMGALQAGAIGYLSKGGNAEELREAIQQAQAGGSPLSPGIARTVVRHFQRIG